MKINLNNMRRAWISQPSTNQPYHHLHGTHVLAFKLDNISSRIWFLSGLITDQEILSSALSNDNAWPENNSYEIEVSVGLDDWKASSLCYATKKEAEGQIKVFKNWFGPKDCRIVESKKQVNSSFSLIEVIST